jgi:hypothetical protein
MFPEDFVQDHLEEYTSEGDLIFDPFSGRGTTAFQSLLMNRRCAAVDINPVAYCISKSKTHTPTLQRVQEEVEALEKRYYSRRWSSLDEEQRSLSPFFRRAYYPSTLRQLLFLRRVLRWRIDNVHCFIAALSLGSLHGERDRSRFYFSNQMPRTISTKPTYSLNYWRAHDMWPHKRDVFEILQTRAIYRLEGQERVGRGSVVLSDARLAARVYSRLRNSVRAAITSPPYYNMLSYEEDQWLRLWFLGGQPYPSYKIVSQDDRYTSKPRYWQFLQEVWHGIAPLMAVGAVLICRIGAIDIDKASLTRGLKKSVISAFPNAELIRRPTTSIMGKRQTDHFLPGSDGCKFEVDYVFSLG